MEASAGMVLAGGRSSRMGTPKAALEWHGATMLHRTVSIVARATDGPVVVVRAPGQELPDLPRGTLVVEDPCEGRGPVQGIATGLAALAGRAEAAFISSTDLPFLHPAFIRRVLGGLGQARSEDGAVPDVCLPVARGYPQPLAAAYRVALADAAERLVREGRLRPAFLFEECVVSRLDDAALKADPLLAALDPELDSVVNVNEPADYASARARPAPKVTVHLCGALARDGAARVTGGARKPDGGAGGGEQGPHAARAATLAEAAEAVGLTVDRRVAAALNGGQIAGDRLMPLVAGDTVFFMSAADRDRRVKRQGNPLPPLSRRLQGSHWHLRTLQPRRWPGGSLGRRPPRQAN